MVEKKSIPTNKSCAYELLCQHFSYLEWFKAEECNNCTVLMYAVVSCMYEMLLCNDKLPTLTVNAFMRVFQQYKQHIIILQSMPKLKTEEGG